jgi:hypothetical protein
MDMTGVSALYVGSTAVDALYMGGEKVWPRFEDLLAACPSQFSEASPPGYYYVDYSRGAITWIWNSHVIHTEPMADLAAATAFVGAVLGVDGNHYMKGDISHILKRWGIRSCDSAGACRTI